MSDSNSMQASLLATNASVAGNGQRDKSWFEAMAEAWGEALDRQANRIVDLSSSLDQGNDTPQQITMLTAESQRMSFLANSSHTAVISTGSALETLARKQ